MKCNIGKVDKTLRIVAGVGMLGAGYVYGSYLGLIGLVPLTTALFSFCPLYSIVGMNTGCKTNK